jgi:hypothetical protein
LLSKYYAIQNTRQATRHTTVNIHQSTGVQVGDHNVINIQNAINELIQKIDNADASPHEKNEAKNRLSALLAHPLVGSILGGVAGSVTSMVGN